MIEIANKPSHASPDSEKPRLIDWPWSKHKLEANRQAQNQFAEFLRSHILQIREGLRHEIAAEEDPLVKLEQWHQEAYFIEQTENLLEQIVLLAQMSRLKRRRMLKALEIDEDTLDALEDNIRQLKTAGRQNPESYVATKVAIYREIYQVLVDFFTSQGMAQDLHRVKTRLNRRDFMTLSSLATAGAAIAAVGLDPEIRTVPEATFARQSPVSEEHEAEAIELDHNLTLSEEKQQELYERYFSDRAEVISFFNWKTLSRYLLYLARLFYFEERAEGQAFDEFFTDFLDNLYSVAEELKIDFVVLIALLRHSGAAQGDRYRFQEDINAERVRVLMSALTRTYKLGYVFQDLVSSQEGLKSRVARFFHKDFPLSLESAQRFIGPPTLGLNDMELQVLAAALFDDSYPYEERQALMVRLEQNPRYKKAIEDLRQLWQKKQLLEEQRTAFEAAVDNFIAQHGEILEVFLAEDSSEQAFTAIGLGDELSTWQKINPTRAAIQLDQVNADKTYELYSVKAKEKIAAWAARLFFTRDKLNYIENPHTDKKIVYKALLQEQIMNPQMIAFLQDLTKDDKELKAAWAEVLAAKRTYQRAGDDLALAEKRAFISAGKLDLVSDFQLPTATAVLKYLQQRSEAEFGQIDSTDKNSIAFQIFATFCIREGTPFALLSAGDCFARDVRVDSPYDISGVFAKLQEWLGHMKLTDGTLIDPTQDFGLFLDAVNAIKTKQYDIFAKEQDYLAYLHKHYLQGVAFDTGIGVASDFFR